MVDQDRFSSDSVTFGGSFRLNLRGGSTIDGERGTQASDVGDDARVEMECERWEFQNSWSGSASSGVGAGREKSGAVG